MSSDNVEEFRKLFADMERAGQPNLEHFVHAALLQLNHLREKIASGTPQEREEALAAIRELQSLLQDKADKAFQATGMDAKQLEKFLGQRSNFTEEQWEMFQKAQQEVTDYQKHLIEPSSEGKEKGAAQQRPTKPRPPGGDAGKKIQFRG